MIEGLTEEENFDFYSYFHIEHHSQESMFCAPTFRIKFIGSNKWIFIGVPLSDIQRIARKCVLRKNCVLDGFLDDERFQDVY